MLYSHIIYKLTFPNGKVYIGQTINYSSRMSDYKNMRGKTIVFKAIRKYKWNNIKKEILFTTSEEFVDETERYFIKKFNSLAINGQGYNIEDGGNKNKHLSEETKKKISKIQKGIKRSDEFKEKLKIIKKGTNKGEDNPMYGRKGNKHPLFGKKRPDTSKRNKIHPPMLGIKQSKEHIKKRIKVHFKSVNVYDINNNFIKNFNSITEASINLNLQIANICKVLKNKRKTTGGYIFKYNIGN